MLRLGLGMEATGATIEQVGITLKEAQLTDTMGDIGDIRDIIDIGDIKDIKGI